MQLLKKQDDNLFYFLPTVYCCTGGSESFQLEEEPSICNNVPELLPHHDEMEKQALDVAQGLNVKYHAMSN
jgi:hypothetical protein